MGVAALAVAIVAALAAVMSAVYVRSQVREMRQEFERSGPYIQISVRYAGKAVGAPLIVDLINDGRAKAQITALIIRPYRGGVMVSGGFVQLPQNLGGRRPPLSIPPGDTVSWSFPWHWVMQQAGHLGFDSIRFEVIRGDLKKIVSESIPVTFVPSRSAQAPVSAGGAADRERFDTIIGPALKAGSDAEAKRAGRSEPSFNTDEMDERG